MKCPYIDPSFSDCQKCPFPDCVNDDFTISDYKDKSIDGILDVHPVTKEQLWNRKSTADYDARNREKKREYARNYYQKHKDKKKLKVREWQEQNYNYLLLYQKEWRTKKKAEKETQMAIK